MDKRLRAACLLVGCFERMEQNAAAGVARGVAARNELRECLSGKLLAAERLPLFVLALHEPCQKVDSVVHVALFQALPDTRDRNTCQVLYGLYAFVEERVR